MAFAAPLPAWVPTSQPFKPGQHLGIDYAAPTGTPVACADHGFVRYKATEADGYGNTLTVEHPGGWESRYAHLLEFPVNQGENVARGQIIAATGGGQGPPGAGFSTGPHLHYELRQWGVPVDPAPLLVHGSTPPSDESEIDMGTPEILAAIAEQTATLGTWSWETHAQITENVNGPQSQWEWDTRQYVTLAIAEQTAVILDALGLPHADVARMTYELGERLERVLPRPIVPDPDDHDPSTD